MGRSYKAFHELSSRQRYNILKSKRKGGCSQNRDYKLSNLYNVNGDTTNIVSRENSCSKSKRTENNSQSEYEDIESSTYQETQPYSDSQWNEYIPMQNNAQSGFPDFFYNVDDIENMQPITDSEERDSVDLGLSSVDISCLIAKWAVNNNIPHCKLSELLAILKQHDCFSNFPLSATTFLKTTTSCKIKTIANGTYAHVGIENNLNKLILNSKDLRRLDCIELFTNVDGAPVAKSSGSQIWPILMSIKNFPEIPPFCVGLYHGYEKPTEINEFLEDFVKEVRIIYEKGGITVNGKCIKICIIGYICDAPARAFLAQIKTHSGYFSCGKCTVEGVYDGNIIFDEFSSPLRTDESFRTKANPDHHIGYSPLENIPNTKMVTHFPLEYMHLVCLGVVRKMLYLMVKGKGIFARLNANNIARISERLVALAIFIPTEFARKPRALKDLLRWKATELRQFILYTGPLVFKDIIHPSLYTHFLCLHVGIRILCSNDLIKCHLNYAENLLQYFVTHFATFFGIKSLSYNVHGLLHLANDAREYGVLDNFSAFPFENFLGFIGKRIRKNDQVVAQLVRRLNEIGNFADPGKVTSSTSVVRDCKLKIITCPPPSGVSEPAYHTITYKNYKISSNSPDNGVLLTNGDIILVEFLGTINGLIVLNGRKFQNVENFYTRPVGPIDSSTVGIYHATNLSEQITIPLENVKCKVIVLPTFISGNKFEGDSYYAVELLN